MVTRHGSGMSYSRLVKTEAVTFFCLACIVSVTGPGGREFVCIPLRHGFKSLAYTSQRAYPQSGPSTKTGLFVGGQHPLGKTHHRRWGSALSVHKQNDPALEFIQKPSSKVTDVLLNAKSRYVGWRLCKSLWDWVLAEGHGSDGQHRKHTGF